MNRKVGPLRAATARERGGARAGFTLLEVVLALSIGLVLLVALYFSLDIQIQHAQVGREVVDQASQARLLLHQITGDILGHLGPGQPQQSSTGSQASGSSSTTNTTSSSSSTSSSGSSSTGTSTSTSSSTTTTSTSRVVFNLGVKGDSQRLILTISRLPRELTDQITQGNGAGGITGISDLRRISYWLLDGDKGGLARQDLTRVTAEDVEALPPDVANPESYLVAPEVKELTFQYFDGSSWQDSWDGGSGTTPQGPPLAIAITVRLAGPREDQGNVYRHVVAIPTANGQAAQDQGTSQP